MSLRSVLTVAGVAAVCVVAALLLRPRPSSGAAAPASPATSERDDVASATSSAQPRRRAICAGGCFWCMEPPFEQVDGVFSVRSGYTAGRTESPTYEQVSGGRTGHTEAVEIEYDPSRVTYEQLLDLFWHNVDPLTANAQFCDHGPQYRSGIYPRTAEERVAAERSRDAVARTLGREVVTEIVDATTFHAAEEYHQDYYKKNPVRYKFYRGSCGRDARLRELWGKAAGVGTLGLISDK